MSIQFPYHDGLSLVPDTRGFNADLIDIHDGDTITVMVNLGRYTGLRNQWLGFDSWADHHHMAVHAQLRLYGINAPELSTPEGKDAKAYLVGLIGQSALTVVPYMEGGHHAKDKYGRWLADVRTGALGTSGLWVNKAMVDSGHAVPYFGGARVTDAPVNAQLVNGRLLDRTNNHDLRSFNYVRDMSALPIVTKTWAYGVPVLDQGQVGACTGFGSTGTAANMPGMLVTQRHMLGRTATAFATYILATNIDKIPGQYPTQDTGSDVNSATKALRDLGYVGLYEWLTTVESIAGAISNVGPVCVGTDFYNSMFTPKPYKDTNVSLPQMVVDEASGLAGGHCYALIGVDAERKLFIVRNSWGTSWGGGGFAVVTWDDFAKLLAAQGDAVLMHRNNTLTDVTHGLY